VVEGLDPQKLYVGRSYITPDGIKTIAAANQWHEQHDRIWDENPPAQHPEFADRWFLRTQDLIDQYDPDLLYSDDTELPLGQKGLDITAHLYNQSVYRRGQLEVVVTGKAIVLCHYPCDKPTGATWATRQTFSKAPSHSPPYRTDQRQPPHLELRQASQSIPVRKEAL
jgi:alpha-L-fucosidase